MRILVFAFARTLIVGQAHAREMIRPDYKPAAAVSDNFYVWVDGTYNWVRLPSSSLGFHTLGPAPFLDNGPTQKFESKLDGAGVRGALGYVLPGSGVRFELGGSHVSADGSSHQTFATPVPSIGPVLLVGGSFGGGPVCNGGLTCVVAGSHRSDYASWEINGKVASDVPFGAFTFSPSLGLFAGNSHNHEVLSQALTQTNGGIVTMNYQAEASLRWTDYGARIGLDAKFPIFGAWTVDAGGWIGVAQRDVSLDASDIIVGNIVAAGSSRIFASDVENVFLGNAEVGVTYTSSPNFRVRGFAGLNYDSKVPGISAPDFVGPFGAAPGTASKVAFSSETSYYVGGGALIKF